ncbi:hypothetical protein BBP40_011199 [Aspergillus hancockii]|nr:hypothetical protein BBP40_011199 [Aspergillus hancockii]
MTQSTFKQFYLPEKRGFNSLVFRSVLKTSPKKGEILVRIKTVSLNWRDGIIAEGTYPFPGPDALVPGSDGAADHIIEVGDTLTLQASFDAVAMHGIIHCIGHITNPDPLGAGKELRGPDAAFLALDRLCILRGVVVGSLEQLQDMLQCFEAQSIRPVIDSVFDYDRVREARKKCIPNTFPVCGACERLDLECVRVAPRHVLPSSRTPAAGGRNQQPQNAFLYTLPPAHLGIKWPSSQVSNRIEPSKRRHAMKFYITTLSQYLTVNEKYNSFLSGMLPRTRKYENENADATVYFLPMSLESPALVDALLAWSSGHLSSLDDTYQLVALQARSTALNLLAESISANGTICCETSAATGLVLLTSEVCLGDHTKWYKHLLGVKHIIMSAQSRGPAGIGILQGPDALKQSPEGQWVLRNFAYHDVLGSVTLGKPPLLHGEYLRGITDVVDTYLGVATEVLITISEISYLEPITLGFDFVQSYNMGNSFYTLEQALISWKCRSSATALLEALAYTYRSAALIYLFRRTLRGLKALNPSLLFALNSNIDFLQPLHGKIQAAVLTLLQHVAEVPLDALPESALLFPLFLAGGEAIDPLHMEMVRMRLRLMLKKRRFQNIQRTLEVLDEVWNRRRMSTRTGGNGDVDWQEIVDRNSEGLLLT